MQKVVFTAKMRVLKCQPPIGIGVKILAGTDVSPSCRIQHYIDDMLNEGYTKPQIVAALKRLGFKTSIRSLERYLQRWHRRRRHPAGTPGVRIGEATDELAEKVKIGHLTNSRTGRTAALRSCHESKDTPVELRPPYL
jgi:hypothetical protein